MVTGSLIARCGEPHVSFRYSERTVRLPAAAEIYNQFAGPGVGCAANSALPRTSRNCSAAAAVMRKLPTASIWFSLSVFETASPKISASVTGSTGPRNPAVGTASKYTTGAEQALRYWHD
jgi:hypothetical protein